MKGSPQTWNGGGFYMLMFAILARERARLLRFLLLPFLFCFLTSHASAASAASLNVKVRQVNPDGAVQQVTCTDKEFKCLLPIDIQTGATKETLTVHVLDVPGNVLFEFETPKGYLYAGEKTPADAHKRPLRNDLDEGQSAKRSINFARDIRSSRSFSKRQ